MFDNIKNKLNDRECDRALGDIANGDMSALSVIYRIYGRMIMSVALQILNNTHDAEDILQDVMVSVAENATRYKIGTNPRAWIMSITRNAALNRLKANEKTVACEALENQNNASREPLGYLLIDDAFNSLSDDDKLIVKLKLYSGLTHSEIASVMNLTLSASEKRYERAIKQIRDYFKKG